MSLVNPNQYDPEDISDQDLIQVATQYNNATPFGAEQMESLIFQFQDITNRMNYNTERIEYRNALHAEFAAQLADVKQHIKDIVFPQINDNILPQHIEPLDDEDSLMLENALGLFHANMMPDDDDGDDDEGYESGGSNMDGVGNEDWTEYNPQVGSHVPTHVDNEEDLEEKWLGYLMHYD